jgi:hypothetical protein
MDFDDASAFAALSLPRGAVGCGACGCEEAPGWIESRVMMVGLQISALHAMRAYAARNSQARPARRVAFARSWPLLYHCTTVIVLLPIAV